MSAVERFIAGEDRLSAMLKAVPVFDAPTRLQSWVQESARAIEAERGPEPAYAFEPSAGVHDAVMREARAMERAQAPRRAVLWGRLGRDENAAEVLGVPVAAATATWLRQQAARHQATPAVTPPVPSRQRWWGQRLAFGAMFSLAVLAGVAGHRYWLAPAERVMDAAPQVARLEPQVMTEASAEVEAMREAPPVAADFMAQRGAEVEAGRASPANMARRRESGRYAEVAAFAPPPPPPLAAASASVSGPAADLALGEEHIRLDELASPLPAAAAKPQLLRPNQRGDMDLVRLSAPPPPPSALYPIDDPQWKALAADVFAANKMPRSQSWRLSTRNPAAAEVVALAAMLLEALPAGMSLKVEADSTVPAGFVRLAPVQAQ
ncbi:hypothetical protein AGMMS49543_00190 [Betaproteobacteria bacterium]|nr:hypothetical protein AGMMS49543_00190 [Betaproteobacteria bacterium]GHU16201.1 hypothetical protein AGMMS50243_01740 [Betaproteobacteria bacterium]